MTVITAFGGILILGKGCGWWDGGRVMNLGVYYAELSSGSDGLGNRASDIHSLLLCPPLLLLSIQFVLGYYAMVRTCNTTP